ncbi:DNA methyltransferase [Nitratireductor sp. XY-223]|uniref:class I SAM-dependent DNA methyltransferase n=1 Tax=Nitratireductor sp. XY-223 TaxID=2561926 RepID=UPI0010AA59E8|nr:DNA methyltransferase [Nitratireductor sp. XY-223]
MNAVEIEEAISQLADQPFDSAEFPFSFLEAFGAKATTIKRLRSGNTNKSDVGGVLQTSNIHIKVCDEGDATETLAALKASSATSRSKAKFVLATDGVDFQAEDLNSGEVVVCDYTDFPDHFGFFLPLAGITTVKQVRESAFDIKATGRLNRLYVQLLKDNPEWGTADRRHEMNHFMARLIFCFFAEDTDIFHGDNLFTATIEQMSARDSSNAHEVISELFRAMDTPLKDRANAKLPRWVNDFPYVNGHLFSGSIEVPTFTRIARSYLLHIGNLDWTKINPDIFGSMIQAVADDEERGALGMHYTSVPNILKVLNPLFLDDLREQLEQADDNPRKLLNLRKRMSNIRVFDPACGSGNFLVIAYKEMRAIEAEINKLRGEPERRTEIPLTNFRGIELRDFPAEIARLALIIAEYQCDVTYRGQKEALAEFLPLDAMNWITCGNALRLDWLSICPPTGTGVKMHGDDLFSTPLDQAEIDFENEGGETYICGNPPYYGSRKQSKEQKSDLSNLCGKTIKKWKSLDYVAGWFLKGHEFIKSQPATFAFVCTSSNCEGLQISVLWKHLLQDGHVYISFAYRPFKWANLAANNAGVTVNVVGVSNASIKQERRIFDGDQERIVDNINPYILATPNVFVDTEPNSISCLASMITGSMPRDGSNLILSFEEAQKLQESYPHVHQFIRPYVGTDELVKGNQRRCLWISDADKEAAWAVPEIHDRLQKVSEMRSESPLDSTQEFADRPHRFVYLAGNSRTHTVGVGGVSSESRDYLPVTLFDDRTIVSNLAYALYDAPLWTIALIASRLHLAWIAAVCGKLETRYRYSNTIGWNTFPVPKLTDKMKDDLRHSAEEILLAREAHFPATIADLYDPEKMPENLRAAHDRNDEVLERIYIGRRFKNDTERLEKLFELYTKMTSEKGDNNKQKVRAS